VRTLAFSRIVSSPSAKGWCPYCNMELKALQKFLRYYNAREATLVGLAPELPWKVKATIRKTKATFPILSDVNNEVARKFGLVFDLPDELRPIYESFGFDVPAYNGDDSWQLPLAATYIIDSCSRRVVYSHVDTDYTKRAEPASLVAKIPSSLQSPSSSQLRFLHHHRASSSAAVVVKDNNGGDIGSRNNRRTRRASDSSMTERPSPKQRQSGTTQRRSFTGLFGGRAVTSSSSIEERGSPW